VGTSLKFKSYFENNSISNYQRDWITTWNVYILQSIIFIIYLFSIYYLQRIINIQSSNICDIGTSALPTCFGCRDKKKVLHIGGSTSDELTLFEKSSA